MRIPFATHCFILLSAIFIAQGQSQSSHRPECVEFTHYYCNRFNYTTAFFPNPRGHLTYEDAAKEFNDFIPLLNNNCHPKLGTLLCFLYFPVCSSIVQYDQNRALVELGFFPCKELCEEVHNSSCTDLIVQHLGFWVSHLQCNFTDSRTGKEYYRNADSSSDAEKCINGVAPRYVPPSNACSSGTANCDENADCIATAGSYMCVCRKGFSGNGRSCEDVDECATGNHTCNTIENAQCINAVGSYSCSCINGYTASKDGNSCTDVDECSIGLHDCHENAECANTEGSYTCTCNSGYHGDGRECTAGCPTKECKPCKVRSNANSKTFKRNCYCYALRVYVVSSFEESCNLVYNVTVKEQFNLKTPHSTLQTTSAPTLTKDQLIMVIANPSNCDPCPSLTLDQDYLIAGAYSRNDDGSVVWLLEGTENKAVASEWISKYDTKLSKWVEDGNNERIANNLCLEQCE